MAIYRLGLGSVSGTAKNNAVVVGTGFVATVANCVLCNNSSGVVNVSVAVNDIVITSSKLSAGVGKSSIVFEAIGGLNAGDTLSFTGDGGAFNYYVAGKTDKT